MKTLMVFKLVMEAILVGEEKFDKGKDKHQRVQRVTSLDWIGERVDKMRGEDSFNFWGVKMSFSDGKQGVNS